MLSAPATPSHHFSECSGRTSEEALLVPHFRSSNQIRCEIRNATSTEDRVSVPIYHTGQDYGRNTNESNTLLAKEKEKLIRFMQTPKLI